MRNFLERRLRSSLSVSRETVTSGRETSGLEVYKYEIGVSNRIVDSFVRTKHEIEDLQVIVNHRNSFIIDFLAYSPHAIQRRTARYKIHRDAET